MQAAEQDFKRETQDRDHAYQLGRDKTQQAHEKDIANLRDNSAGKLADEQTTAAIVSKRDD